MKAFRDRCPAGGNKIAAILIEPMQCEGGDRTFRPEFLQALRDFAHESECLLIFDEVQTGFFGSGKPWYWQHSGATPDLVAFGKKSQVVRACTPDRVLMKWRTTSSARAAESPAPGAAASPTWCVPAGSSN